MSVRRLADLAEISNPYLSQIERGLRRPSADILQQIAKALRISSETLYVRAGMLDASAEGQISVPDAINRDERLSPEQKASLLTVYQSFVSRMVEPADPVDEHGDQHVVPASPKPARKAKPR